MLVHSRRGSETKVCWMRTYFPGFFGIGSAYGSIADRRASRYLSAWAGTVTGPTVAYARRYRFSMIAEGQILPYHCSQLPAGPWLVFAPHADDETFGMGGALLKACAQGIATHLVVVTDGALGGSAKDLVNTRHEEAQTAAEALGMASVSFLGQPDRGLQRSDALASRIAALISDQSVASVFFPGAFEPHPDHRSTALLAWKALQELPDDHRPAAIAYEITVQSPTNLLIDISDQIAGKRKVMEIYLSQLAENNYADIVTALNRARTFSLPPETAYAEAFYCFSDVELQQPLQQLMLDKVRQLLV